MNEIIQYSKRIGFNLLVEIGPDIPEIDGSIDEVIIYKSLDSGKGTIVEDTILVVDNEPIIDIKWKVELLPSNTTGTWITSLGYNDGTDIRVYRGSVNGTIIKPRGTGNGFDPYFIPEGSELTLGELKSLSTTEVVFWSARERAIWDLSQGNHIFTVPISSIQPWKGRYQNES